MGRLGRLRGKQHGISNIHILLTIKFELCYRRNKYAMGEKVRASGTRAVKQRLCRSQSELTEYLELELGFRKAHQFVPGEFSEDSAARCVVKPVQSAGSDCVYMCTTFDEALEAFDMINGKRNGLGLINDGALVQEFLSGKEYVIDKVSILAGWILLHIVTTFLNKHTGV